MLPAMWPLVVLAFLAVPQPAGWSGTWTGTLVNLPTRPDAPVIEVIRDIGPLPDRPGACTPWKTTYREAGVVRQVKDYALCRDAEGDGWSVDEGGGTDRDRQDSTTLYETLQDEVTPLYYARDGVHGEPAPAKAADNRRSDAPAGTRNDCRLISVKGHGALLCVRLPKARAFEESFMAKQLFPDGTEVVDFYVRAVKTGLNRRLAESQGFTWDRGMYSMALAHNSGMVAATEIAPYKIFFVFFMSHLLSFFNMLAYLHVDMLAFLYININILL